MSERQAPVPTPDEARGWVIALVITSTLLATRAALLMRRRFTVNALLRGQDRHRSRCGSSR